METVAVRWRPNKPVQLKLTDTPEGLKFEVKKLPKTSYAKDFLALLRAGSIAPGIIPIFSRIPKDVDANADYDEPEKGNPGVFPAGGEQWTANRVKSILFRPPQRQSGQSVFNLSVGVPESLSHRGLPAHAGWLAACRMGRLWSSPKPGTSFDPAG